MSAVNLLMCRLSEEKVCVDADREREACLIQARKRSGVNYISAYQHTCLHALRDKHFGALASVAFDS